MLKRFSPWFSIVLALTCVACGDDAAPSGGSDGGGTSDAGIDTGSTAGSSSNAGSGGTAGTSSKDDGGSGSGGTAGTGSVEPSCDDIEGKTPTWTIIDPKLPDFEATQDMTSANPAVKGFGGLAYGNGTFVALGMGTGQDVFRWATSKDGETWTAHSEKLAKDATLYSISRVRFVGGKFRFFAEHLNDGFHVHTSTDGTTWEDAIVQIGERGLAVEFDASPKTFVYAGTNGDMRSTDDLETWVKRSDTAAGGFDFMDIAFGDGLWISTGNGGAVGWFSDDGKSWNAFDDGVLGGGTRIEYGNGVWLAQQGSVVKTSEDGKTFTMQTTTGLDTGYEVRFAGGHFVTLSFPGLHPNFEVLISDDGITWTKFGDFAPVEKREGDMAANMYFRDTAFGNCRYVMAGTLQYTPPIVIGDPYILTDKPMIVLGTFE